MDDDVIVISSDNESDNASSDDIQSENDSDNSESLLLPILPAKKVFTPTKKLRSSPTSDDSESDGFDEGHGQRYSSCITTYDRSVSESENECVYANEMASNRYVTKYKVYSTSWSPVAVSMDKLPVFV